MHKIVLLIAVLLAVAACAPRDVAPTPAPEVHASGENRSHYGAATASIEERIWLSDVVVRANLQSAAAGSLTFRAVEYLKGTGPSTFTVSADTDGRPTTWDGQEALLFLKTPAQGAQGASGTSSFAFTDTTTWRYGSKGPEHSYTGTLPAGYAVNSRNPVWVPLSSGGASGASGGGENLDLDELRTTVAWLAGSGPGYEDCVRLALSHIRWYRDRDVYTGLPGEFEHDGTIPSGDATTPLLTDRSTDSAPARTAYRNRWILGQDRDLFSAVTIDDDTDPTNGFTEVLRAARPLPAGSYRFLYRAQNTAFVPCDYRSEDAGAFWNVTVTAPAGKVHEAFFDPVAIGTAVGADGTNGTLKPTAFTVGGVSTALQSLKWESDTLTLGLSSAASLSGHALDFIALDGSVALSLDGGAATVSGRTLTWSVTDQPWQAGDLLMLRIRSGAPVATPTPTATPVPPAPPVFGSSTYAFSVAENAATGTAVGTVAATDANDDAVTYSVTAGNGDGAFAIDSASGAITVAGSLDRETTASYTLTVQAADGNGGTGTATVAVTVTKANEAPVFGSDSYSFSAAETASAYSVIGTVAATDADGDAVTYWITAGNGSGTFSIDLNEGFVLVRKALDYETTTSYTLTVEARDGNGGVDTATVAITVTDVEGS